jgi:PAS domain-containing protein
MVISHSISAHELHSRNTSLCSQFAYFDWNIPENEMTLCPYLSEILAFETTDITQDFNDWYDLNHPEDKIHIDLMLESIKNKQTQYAVSESRTLCRDGQWRWFSLHGKVIELDNDCNPLRVVGTCTDITKLKETEVNFEQAQLLSFEIKRIKECQRDSFQLQNVCEEIIKISGKFTKHSPIGSFVEHLPSPMGIFDTNMSHLYVNNAWKTVPNDSNEQDFIGKSHYEVYKDQPAIWKEHHQRALNGEIVAWQSEVFGGVFYSGFTFPWQTLSGSIGGIVIYLQDITEYIVYEKNLNKELKYANEALEYSNSSLKLSNESLESFAHICSHDLKEPLRSVSNFINLLFTRNIESFDEESLIYMRYALKGIDRMGSLIQGILLYSKIVGRREYPKVILDMGKLMSEIKEVFNYKITEISAEINIGNLPPILGEPTQINQLFTNLIANALKFRSERPLAINIFAEERDSLWEFHVCDNGIGIAQEYHESVFTMFKRLHSKVTVA